VSEGATESVYCVFRGAPAAPTSADQYQYISILNLGVVFLHYYSPNQAYTCTCSNSLFWCFLPFMCLHMYACTLSYSCSRPFSTSYRYSVPLKAGSRPGMQLSNSCEREGGPGNEVTGYACELLDLS
jgi:hypothetical protein